MQYFQENYTTYINYKGCWIIRKVAGMLFNFLPFFGIITVLEDLFMCSGNANSYIMAAAYTVGEEKKLSESFFPPLASTSAYDHV